MLARSWARMVEAGDDIGDLPTPALHALRLRGKRMRYACEFFAPLFPDHGARRWTRRLADLQDALGHLNDAAVAGALMGALGDAGQGHAGGLVRGYVAAGNAGLRAPIAHAWRRLRRLDPRESPFFATRLLRGPRRRATSHLSSFTSAGSEGGLALHRPRRIFRSNIGSSGSKLGGSVPPTLLAGLLGVGFGALVMMLALPADLFGRVPVLSGELHAESGQVAVVDGQTLRLHETTVRLAGVLAPPRGQGCRDGAGA
eukprot:gene55109-75519_t